MVKSQIYEVNLPCEVTSLRRSGNQDALVVVVVLLLSFGLLD